MHFTQVWSISTQPFDTGWVTGPLVAGSLLVILGSVALYSRKKEGADSSFSAFLDSLTHYRFPASKFFIPFGVIFIAFGIACFIAIRVQTRNLAHELEIAKLQTVEGSVEVGFEQPFSGHTGGDLIYIGNRGFQINFFHETHYYHDSIAHGGLLRPGNYVKVYFIPTTQQEEEQFGDGKILKIEQGRAN